MPENYSTKTVRFPLVNRRGEIVAYTVVDIEDLPLIQGHNWRVDAYGYAERGEGSYSEYRKIYMHRVILGLTDRSIEGDHIDHDKLNNTRNNLRAVSHKGNTQNVISHSDSVSKYRGVSWHKKTGKWVATGKLGGKQAHLGLFTNELDAAKAASDFRREHMPSSVED